MKRKLLALILVLTVLVLGGCIAPEQTPSSNSFVYAEVPEYDSFPYVEINNNLPYFNESDYSTDSYEYYSELDSLGRCGVAMACVGQDLMPDTPRGSIGHIKPTGWHSDTYDCISTRNLYNRCHLIGFQLTGENANRQNLITGTRYLNTEGMLPFEDLVADYVKETDNHVLYRVTPVFIDQELVARGVLMEGLSMEDHGESVCFCVFSYNVQPGISIDYATGDSAEEGLLTDFETEYVVNTSTGKFHKPDCPNAQNIRPDHREEFHGPRDLLIRRGLEPCGRCRP